MVVVYDSHGKYSYVSAQFSGKSLTPAAQNAFAEWHTGAETGSNAELE